MQTSRPVAACDLPAEAPSLALLRALSRLGDKALAQDSVEFKARTEEGKGDLVPITDVVTTCTARLA